MDDRKNQAAVSVLCSGRDDELFERRHTNIATFDANFLLPFEFVPSLPNTPADTLAYP